MSSEPARVLALAIEAAEVEGFRLARIYGNTLFMARPIEAIPKKRGRPPSGGRDPIVPARFPKGQIEAIDAWAAHAGDGVTRSEAIRRLVALGLKAKAKAR